MKPPDHPPTAPTWAPENPQALSRAPLEATPFPLSPNQISWTATGVVFTTQPDEADFVFPVTLFDLGTRRSLDLRTSFKNVARRQQVVLEPEQEGESGLRVEVAVATTLHLRCRALGSRSTLVTLRVGGINCEALLPALEALEAALQERDLELPFTLKRARPGDVFVLTEGLSD